MHLNESNLLKILSRIKFNFDIFIYAILYATFYLWFLGNFGIWIIHFFRVIIGAEHSRHVTGADRVEKVDPSFNFVCLRGFRIALSQARSHWVLCAAFQIRQLESNVCVVRAHWSLELLFSAATENDIKKWHTHKMSQHSKRERKFFLLNTWRPDFCCLVVSIQPVCAGRLAVKNTSMDIPWCLHIHGIQMRATIFLRKFQIDFCWEKSVHGHFFGKEK